MQSANYINDLILQGEGSKVEFKVRVPSKVKELTEEVCAFVNADGGFVILGDRLSITNPGGLLPEVAKDFGHKSVSRNPTIVTLFTRMQLVEKVGSGIPRMRKAMREAGLEEPEVEGNGMYTIIFKKSTTPKADDTTPKTEVDVEESIMKLIENNLNIT